MKEYLREISRRMQGDKSSNSALSLFLFLFLILQFILVFNVFTIFRYLSIDVGAWWLVGVVDDGFCDPSIGEGVGQHCFGDYSITASIASVPNPWDDSIFGGSFNYAAGGILLFKVLSSFELLLGIQNFGLFAYLALTILLLMVPALMIGKQAPLSQRILLAFGTLSSLPALLAIDRGNSVGIAIPLLFLFVHFYNEGQIRKSIFFLVLSSLVKPQFSVFLLLFIFRKQWKDFFAALLLIGVTQVVSFLAWPNAFPHSLEQAFRAILGYSNHWDLTNPDLNNTSIGQGLIGIAAYFEIDAQNQSQAIVFVILAMMAGAIFLMTKRLSSLTLLVFLGTAGSFGVNVSWGYYALIPLIYLHTLIQPKSDRRPEPSYVSMVLVAVGSAFTLSRLIFVIPSSAGWEVVDNTRTIGLMWLVISISMAILDWHKNKIHKEAYLP
jgi:hypothetical protein